MATRATASILAMGRHQVLGGSSSSSQAMGRRGMGSNPSSSRAATMERLPANTTLAASRAGHRALSLQAVASSRGTTPAYSDRLVISLHGHSKTWGPPTHFIALPCISSACFVCQPVLRLHLFQMKEVVVSLLHKA